MTQMRKSLRILLPLATAAMPLAMMSAAHADSGQTYQATLDSINKSGGSGMLTLTMNGSRATVTESYSGLAAKFMGGPYPHVQHIHVSGQGKCPSPSADKNGDGIVDTVEGQPAYGPIGTTLSVKGDTSAKAGTNVKIAPGGSSTNYSRTITLDDKTAQSVKDGTAVIVVHGLDPTTLSKKAQKEKSNLVPSLPLAATTPALCGALTSMPSGGPNTGAGSTGGPEDLGLLVLGGGLLAAAGVVYGIRRRGDKIASQQG